MPLSPGPVDGKKRAVRDLSSGAQILWKEELGPRASEVARDLESRFEALGAPLVVKVDNGSAFIAGEIKEMCLRWGVELLWSPPRTPRYNGVIESGIRWMQHRTEHRATSAGRPGEWKAQDLRTARERTNELPKDSRTSTKPRGEVFGTRAGITPKAALRRKEDTAIQRQAMRRTLVALGFLNITMRRVPLTLKSIIAAKIS